MPAPISPEDLRQMLVMIIAGATDGDKERWAPIVGKLIRTDLSRSPASNWTVKMRRAPPTDSDIIKRAVALVKAKRPYVRW